MSSVGECVGLWLAEGDNKTTREITFTNSCVPLVEFFGNTVMQLFKDYSFNPRIYVYSKNAEEISLNLKVDYKFYKDIRARKPYFLFRIASVKLYAIWKKLVEDMLTTNSEYPSIIRGFFAGEGSVKIGSHSNRCLRISQKEPSSVVEKMLDILGLTYSFYSGNRTYEITGKWNWDIFADKRLADLHPDKKIKFWENYVTFRQDHYPDFYIRNKLLNILDKPYSVEELAVFFNRSKARLSEILIDLKKDKLVKNFRVYSKSYWTSNKNIKIISAVKNKYLELLQGKRTSELAREMKVCWKSASKRLHELEKLELVKKHKNKWYLLDNNYKIIVK